MTTYTYDYEGKLQTRTDARGTQVTYGYDCLHRLLSKSYSSVAAAAGCAGTAAAVAATPQVPYTYDQGGANSVGHVTEATAVGQSRMKFSNFDQLGRPGQSSQDTNATVYPMTYAYMPRAG